MQCLHDSRARSRVKLDRERTGEGRHARACKRLFCLCYRVRLCACERSRKVFLTGRCFKRLGEKIRVAKLAS